LGVVNWGAVILDGCHLGVVIFVVVI
jgi:hypothetical protein